MAFSFFKFIKKPKLSPMSGNPSTPGHEPSTGPFGPSTTASDETLFLQVYEHAKLNDNWAKVAKALKEHPDWLSRIPQGRRWTTLHQIVFSGNIKHLDEVLSFQVNNPGFRLLIKAADDKTVRDVAIERAHIHQHMIRHIERLIFCDQLLNNAKEDKWDLVKNALRQKSDLANEKPPYRRRYLVHQLAFRGLLNEFKDLHDIAPFRLDVLAEGQTPSQLARVSGHQEFASYLDTLPSTAATGSSASGSSSSTSGSSAHPPGQPKYSPGFYDDVSISIMPAGGGSSGFTLSTHGGSPHHHHPSHFPAMTPNLFLTTYGGEHASGYSGSGGSSGYGGGASGGGGGGGHHHYHGSTGSAKTSAKKKPMVPSMSEDEQSKYETTVTSNADKVTGSQLLASMTCCITKQILRDPVVAADGFTYEREAILKWFEHSKRSPMTNQELETLDLKPNHALKSILTSLEGGAVGSSAEKSKEKDSGKK